ncbi:MAG: HD domain-containing protein [Lachnospiraceae bacterium]|nr:HD domain-containing protein [Lachnospiraceae bacterium]
MKKKLSVTGRIQFSDWIKRIIVLTAITALIFPARGISAYTETSGEPAADEEDQAAQQSATVNGGGAAVTKQLTIGGYATKLYDSGNGLPTSESNAILATRDGFIWIGSYSGLIRYDGSDFERYDSSTGITSVNALFEDSRNRLWIGTNDNGLIYLERGVQTQFTQDDGLLSSAIRTIAEDEAGTIYAGTTHGIAYIEEITGESGEKEQKLSLLNDPQLIDEYIIRLCEAPDGSIYGNTRSGALFSIRDKQVTSYFNGEDIGTGAVTTVFPDPDRPGFVYIGTDGDHIYYGSFANHFSDLTGLSIDPAAGANWIIKAANRIFVCTDGDIGYFDEKNQFTILHNLPMNNSIGSMIEDYEGNLWFTSSRQGVMKIVSNRFTNITEMAGLEPAVVNSTCVSGDLLYIGTDAGLEILDLSNRYSEIHNELTKLLSEARIRCIISDLEGNIWISTYSDEKGLVCYKKDGTIQSYTEENGLLNIKVRCTSLMSDGSVLAGTNGGVNVIKDGEITGSYGEANGITNTVSLTVCEGDNNKIYVGTDGDGIYIIDGAHISRLGRKDGLTSEVILRIKKDEERGVYWIITSNSLAYMKDEVITTVRSFPYSNNYDIYFDIHGNAWILASNGIYVVNAEDMIEKETFEYLFYDTTNGLPSVATGNSFSALTEDGTLYIAGRSGVNSLNINDYFDSAGDVNLTIPYIDVDDERYYIGEDLTVTIPSSAKVVTIYDYALTYSMQNPRIQYYLERFDHEPTQLTKHEMEPVRYTNLDGGRYVFHLSVINPSTGEIQKSTEITIRKELAVYEQPWVWILAAICLGILIYILVQRYIHKRTNALQKEAEERKIFVNEIVGAFAKCVDARDEYTNGHAFRVAKYTRMLTKKLLEAQGKEDEALLDEYYNVALMHDIGKISIPDDILNKKAKLDDEEYETMKSHAARGYDILKDVKIQTDLSDGAHYHHERYDGKGYPEGLKGDEIPWVARIIAVADSFDAMYSTRPYREKLPLDYVASEIEKGAGTQFDPQVVEKFMELVREGAFEGE